MISPENIAILRSEEYKKQKELEEALAFRQEAIKYFDTQLEDYFADDLSRKQVSIVIPSKYEKLVDNLILSYTNVGWKVTKSKYNDWCSRWGDDYKPALKFTLPSEDE